MSPSPSACLLPQTFHLGSMLLLITTRGGSTQTKCASHLPLSKRTDDILPRIKGWSNWLKLTSSDCWYHSRDSAYLPSTNFQLSCIHQRNSSIPQSQACASFCVLPKRKPSPSEHRRRTAKETPFLWPFTSGDHHHLQITDSKEEENNGGIPGSQN